MRSPVLKVILTLIAVFDLYYARLSRKNSPGLHVARRVYNSIDPDIHFDSIKESKGRDIGKKRGIIARPAVSDDDIRQFLETLKIGAELGSTERNLFNYLESMSNTPDNIQITPRGG